MNLKYHSNKIDKELARDFPDYKEDLLNLYERMVNLEIPFKSMYYANYFQGSSSIKKVLPSLIPELSYYRLNIQNGTDAQAIFRNLINGKYHQNNKKGKLFYKIKKDLLDYYSLDTYAMVVLLRKLQELLNCN